MARADIEKSEGEVADDQLPRKKWSGKKIVMIAVPALLVLGGGGYAASQFLGGGDKAHKEAAEAAQPETVYIDLPDILVNLKAPDRKSSYLKLSISLEVKGKEQADQIQKMLPRVIDSFQVYLRELRIDDLSGSAGMFRLKEELLRQVNTNMAPLRVNDVLFKEMLVQ